MSFLMLHKETITNSFQASLVNPAEIVAIVPLAGMATKWSKEQARARVELSNGTLMNVCETVESIMEQMQGGRKLQNLEATGDKLEKLSGALAEITRTAKNLQMQTA